MKNQSNLQLPQNQIPDELKKYLKENSAQDKKKSNCLPLRMLEGFRVDQIYPQSQSEFTLVLGKLI